MRPLVRTAALNGYVELSRSLGIDPQQLLRHVGLDAADLAVQDRWVDAAAVVRLLELSAAAAGREDFGLRMSELRRFANLGPISLVVREEPDVRSALGMLLRHEHMYNEALHARLSERNGLAVVEVGLDPGEAMAQRQATELAVGAFERVLLGFLGPDWRPLSVCFTHSAPADTAPYPQVLGATAEFDREFNGIVFYAADLDSTNAMSDPLLRTYAQRYLEAIAVPRDTTVLDRVQEMIEVLLPTGRCSIEQIARGLGVDRRTVHRQLAQSGETFSSLLNATRVRLVEQQLANPRRSLTEIADLLGFSAPSAFSRWFRGQFGCSARDWRTRRTR